MLPYENQSLARAAGRPSRCLRSNRHRPEIAASLTWRLDLLSRFLKLFMQCGICIAGLLPQEFKFTIIVGEHRVDFGLVCKIECNGPVYFLKAQHRKGLSDAFRSRPAQESIDNGIKRDARPRNPVSGIPFLDVVSRHKTLQ